MVIMGRQNLEKIEKKKIVIPYTYYSLGTSVRPVYLL